MGEPRSGEDLPRDLHGLADGQPPLDQVLERRPLDVLHGDVRHALVLAAVVDRDDVWVLKARGGCGLPAEPLDELLVLGVARKHELERDPAAEHPVVRRPDVGHPTGAEPVQQPVAAGDKGVGGERRRQWRSASITWVAIGPATSAPKQP